MLVVNPALADRLDGIAREYLVTRYSGPGNPMRSEVLRRGNVIATKVPYVPTNHLMNCATGLASEDDVSDVARFYAATSQRFWVEITPTTPVEVVDALIALKFRAVSSSSSLYTSPLPPTTQRDIKGIDGIEIVEVDDGLLREFLDTMNVGFGTPDQVLEGMRRNQGFWTSVATWHLFLARVDGVAAGAAVLSMHNGDAYLAAASTLVPFRQRGVQSALIATRIDRARSLGANLISGQAAWGSSSAANMQRAGLQLSHVRVLWTNKPGPD